MEANSNLKYSKDSSSEYSFHISNTVSPVPIDTAVSYRYTYITKIMF